MKDLIAKKNAEEKALKKAKKEEEEEARRKRIVVEPLGADATESHEGCEEDDEDVPFVYPENLAFLRYVKKFSVRIGLILSDGCFFDPYKEDRAIQKLLDQDQGSQHSSDDESEYISCAGYGFYTLGLVESYPGEMEGRCFAYPVNSRDVSTIHISNVLPLDILLRLLSTKALDDIDPAILRIAHELIVCKKRAYIPDNVKDIYKKNKVPFVPNFGEYTISELSRYFPLGYVRGREKRQIKQQMQILGQCEQLLVNFPPHLRDLSRRWMPDIPKSVTLFSSLEENCKCEYGLIEFYQTGYLSLPHVKALQNATENCPPRAIDESWLDFTVFVPAEIGDGHVWDYGEKKNEGEEDEDEEEAEEEEGEKKKKKKKEASRKRSRTVDPE